MSFSSVLLAGMIGLFMLALGYIVIFVLYQRRMIARDLQQQKLETDYQKKLLQAVIENQEAERKRIAHDLHDEIGALLTTSKLYFNQLSPGRAEEQLEAISSKMNVLFDEMMGNIRRISHDLRPVVLENLGLIEAIESAGQKLRESGMDFNFIHQLTFTLSRKAELMLYRIIQELIHNTLKHARASRIDLMMDTRDDVLHLKYEDNGIGFSPLIQAPGLGLKSIESRLSLVNASIQMTKPERGICFLIQINLSQLTEHERD
jgi:signal transduction histidine kinase